MSDTFTLNIGPRVFQLRRLPLDKRAAWDTALQYHDAKLQQLCANPGQRTAADVEAELRDRCYKVLHRYDPIQFTKQRLRHAPLDEIRDAVIQLRDAGAQR